MRYESYEDEVEERVPLWRSFLELIRLPNLFTAAADVLMGFLFVQNMFLPAERFWSGNVIKALTPLGQWIMGLLIAASCLLYAGGVVLNDVFDLERDRDERPRRPLPSGRISLRAARWLGWELLMLGTFCGCAVGFYLRLPQPAIIAVLLAGTILLYNGLLKRTPIGPVAMGACRMLNVLLGMSVLGAAFQIEHWLVAASIGVYIAGVTWFARREHLRSHRVELTAGMLVMLTGVGLLAGLPKVTGDAFPQPFEWFAAIGLLGLIIGGRCVWAINQPSPGRVRMAVTQAILTLIFLDAMACYYATKEIYWPVIILMLLVPAMFLSRWIEST